MLKVNSELFNSEFILNSANFQPELGSQNMAVLELVMGSGPVVFGVLILLVVMSVVTWGIVITKFFQFISTGRQIKKFGEVFWSSGNLEQVFKASQRLGNCPTGTVFQAGYQELKRNQDVVDLESVGRSLRWSSSDEITKLERGMTFLATTASAAPFIGLFGTVWGIMNAFIGLSSVKTSSIQAVAPGISEALIATAVGLAAAIPAAIAYNYFGRQVKVIARRMETFSSEFLNVIKPKPLHSKAFGAPQQQKPPTAR